MRDKTSKKPEYFGLIEAYWNVNVFLGYCLAAEFVGLIEAYWNVNLVFGQ